MIPSSPPPHSSCSLPSASPALSLPFARPLPPAVISLRQPCRAYSMCICGYKLATNADCHVGVDVRGVDGRGKEWEEGGRCEEGVGEEVVGVLESAGGA